MGPQLLWRGSELWAPVLKVVYNGFIRIPHQHQGPSTLKFGFLHDPNNTGPKYKNAGYLGLTHR